MGFTATNDHPMLAGDCITLKRLESDIIRNLKRASSSLSDNINPYLCHTANHYSQVWFGDNEPEWIALLKFKLNRMAAILEHHPIYVHRVPLSDPASAAYATATPPTDGWQDYTADNNGLDFIARSHNQNFKILLGRLWHDAPMYRLCEQHSIPIEIDTPMPSSQVRRLYYYCTQNHISKFHILVHELSHLMQGTLDNAYGYHRTMTLAKDDSNSAKVNAENWGFFLEEFTGRMSMQKTFCI